MPLLPLVWNDYQFNTILVSIFENDEIEALRKLFRIMYADASSLPLGPNLKWYTESNDAATNNSTTNGIAALAMGSDTASVSGSYVSTISSSYTTTDITSNVASIIACSNDPNTPRVLGSFSNVFAAIASSDVININSSSQVAVLAATRPDIINSKDSLVASSEDSRITNGSQQSTVAASVSSAIENSQSAFIAASSFSDIRTALNSAVIASNASTFVFPSINSNVLIGSSSQVTIGSSNHVTVLSSNNANLAGSSVNYFASIANLNPNLANGLADIALVAASENVSLSSPFVFSAIACRFSTFDSVATSAAIAAQSSSMISASRSAIMGANIVTAGPSFSHSAVVGASSVNVSGADTTVVQASNNINVGNINSSRFTIQASENLVPGSINSNVASSIIASDYPQLSNSYESTLIGTSSSGITNGFGSMIAASQRSSINTSSNSGILFTSFFSSPVPSINLSQNSGLIASIDSEINSSNRALIGSGDRSTINQSNGAAVLASTIASTTNGDSAFIGACWQTSLTQPVRTSALSSINLTYNNPFGSVCDRLTFASLDTVSISNINPIVSNMLAASSRFLNLAPNNANAVAVLSASSGTQTIYLNTIANALVTAFSTVVPNLTLSGNGLACISSTADAANTIFAGAFSSSISSQLEFQSPNTNSTYCSFISSRAITPTTNSNHCLVASSQNSSLTTSARSAIVSSNNSQIISSGNCLIDSSEQSSITNSLRSSIKSSVNVQLSNASMTTVISSDSCLLSNIARSAIISCRGLSPSITISNSTLVGCRDSGSNFGDSTVNIGLGQNEDNSLARSLAIGTFNTTVPNHATSRVVRVIKNSKSDSAGVAAFKMNKSPGIGGNPQYVLAVGKLRVLIFNTATNDWGVAEYAISFYRATNFLGTSLVISNGSGPGNINPFTINITYNPSDSTLEVTVAGYTPSIEIGASLDVSFLS